MRPWTELPSWVPLSQCFIWADVWLRCRVLAVLQIVHCPPRRPCKSPLPLPGSLLVDRPQKPPSPTAMSTHAVSRLLLPTSRFLTSVSRLRCVLVRQEGARRLPRWCGGRAGLCGAACRHPHAQPHDHVRRRRRRGVAQHRGFRGQPRYVYSLFHSIWRAKCEMGV